MRVSAYVLAGDPAWCAESVASYYDRVDRIVVSYDENNRSWSGGTLEVPRALDALREVDRHQKMVMLAGDFSDPTRPALEMDTRQRQVALEAAGEGSDWVVQLDTDEVLADPDAFFDALTAADARGCDALDFPARWLYQRTSAGDYLERSGRFWTARAGYPGPVAVRAGATLVHCRQTPAPAYRVDFSHRNTDPSHPRDARVDAVVRPDQAVIHLSWVRTDSQMRRKSVVSGHAGDPRWPAAVARWERAREHPWLTVLGTPFQRDPEQWLRRTRLPRTVAVDWPA